MVFLLMFMSIHLKDRWVIQHTCFITTKWFGYIESTGITPSNTAHVFIRVYVLWGPMDVHVCMTKSGNTHLELHYNPGV